MEAIIANEPLSRLREREGPNAKHWEGEGLRLPPYPKCTSWNSHTGLKPTLL